MIYCNYFSKSQSQAFSKQDTLTLNQNFNGFKTKLLLELTALDQRFPTSQNVKKLSLHVLKLANHCLMCSTNQENKFEILSDHMKDDLLKVIEYHKERMRVETSELARELRDASPQDLDQHLMILQHFKITQNVKRLFSLLILYFIKFLNLYKFSSLKFSVQIYKQRQEFEIHFIDKLQAVFIQVCQQLIKSFEERQNLELSEDSIAQIEEQEKEILLSISKILETLVAQTEYLLKLKNPQGQETMIVYVDKQFQKYLKSKCKKFYKVFAFGVNALITRHKSYKIQASCLRLLKRFYEIFEKHQVVLEDTILTCLQNFAEFEDVKKHKTAALFYYHLLHSFETNENFKRKLREDKSLDILKFNPHFSSIFYIHFKTSNDS